jgi:monoamine oxidase
MTSPDFLLPSAAKTRRQFLTQVGMVGGTGMVMAAMAAWGSSMASATEVPPDLRGSGKGKKIVILGAGHAGMTAAYEMSKLGYECTILEARSFAGGRCQTARRGTTVEELGGEKEVCTFDEGQYINPGPWRIPFNHRSTLYYTRKFGVPLEVMVNENDAAYAYYQNGNGPLKGKRVRHFEVKADMRGHTSELVAKAVSTGKFDGDLTPEDKAKFLEFLVSDGYLDKKELTYKGTGGRGFAVNPGAGIDPGPGVPSTIFPFGDVLQSNLWNTMHSVGEFVMQKTMFEPVGGMDGIAKGWVRNVGHMIKYNCEVEQIRQSDKSVTVNYVDTKTGKKGTISGDYAVCTIPLSVLRGIDADFSAPFKEAMSGVAYMPVCKMGLQFKRRFWEEDDGIYGGHCITDIPGAQLVSLPSSNWQGTKGVILGYYNFADKAVEFSGLSLAERAEFCLDVGSKLFPQYRPEYETGFSLAWHRVKYNLGGWAEWSDDSRKRNYPKLLEADGRVYLAGEHLSYLGGWQAGAIESAWQQIEKIHTRAQAA